MIKSRRWILENGALILIINSAQPTGERNNGEACYSVTHNHKNRTKNSE